MQSADLYRLAAQQGNASAQFDLGLLYDNGEGVAQDYTLAAKWYRKAAEQGLPRAQFNLGSLYAGGQGVGRDYVESWFWLNLAALTWSGAHQQEAAQARDKVGALLTADQIQQDQQRTQRWLSGKRD